MIPSYLDEFMWRERYGKDGGAAFENILRVLAEHYYYLIDRDLHNIFLHYVVYF